MVIGDGGLRLSERFRLLLQLLVHVQRLRVGVLRNVPALAFLAEQMLVVSQDPLIFAVPVASSLWPSFLNLQFLLVCPFPTGSDPCVQQYPPMFRVLPISLSPPLFSRSCPFRVVCAAGMHVIV